MFPIRPSPPPRRGRGAPSAAAGSLRCGQRRGRDWAGGAGERAPARLLAASKARRAGAELEGVVFVDNVTISAAGTAPGLA